MGFHLKSRVLSAGRRVNSYEKKRAYRPILEHVRVYFLVAFLNAFLIGVFKAPGERGDIIDNATRHDVQRGFALDFPPFSNPFRALLRHETRQNVIRS